MIVLGLSLSGRVVLALASDRKIEEKNVINIVERAKIYLHQHGKQKAINEFKKNSSQCYTPSKGQHNKSLVSI